MCALHYILIFIRQNVRICFTFFQQDSDDGRILNIAHIMESMIESTSALLIDMVDIDSISYEGSNNIFILLKAVVKSSGIDENNQGITAKGVYSVNFFSLLDYDIDYLGSCIIIRGGK